MRKKHQAVLINSAAKKNFCNEISLGNFTYESEQKNQLRDFFNNNINDDDVENQDEDSINSSDDESFEVSKIKVPTLVNNSTKEYAKFQISEKALLGGIDPFNYETIPHNSINICYDSSLNNEDNNKDLGATIKFIDIIKQFIYWKDKNATKDKKNCDIDSFQLFNLDPDKIKYIKEKLIELKKTAKDKKIDGNDSLFNKFLTEMENHYTEQKKELNNLISNFDNIDTVSYGNKWSVVGFQKAKTPNPKENV